MSYFQLDIPSVVAEYYVDMADAGKFVAFQECHVSTTSVDINHNSNNCYYCYYKRHPWVMAY